MDLTGTLAMQREGWRAWRCQSAPAAPATAKDDVVEELGDTFAAMVFGNDGGWGDEDDGPANTKLDLDGDA